MSKINEFVKEQRESRKWSLREMSSQTGLSHSYIALLEDTNTEPSIDTLTKLANAFGMSLTEILQAGGYLDEKDAEVAM